MENKKSSSVMSLEVLLTIIFIILKLTNVIDWSWWWVFSPLLIALGLMIFTFIILGFIYYIKS